MARHISPERKTAYAIGMGITVIGVLLFASVFVSSIFSFGDFTDFHSRRKSEMIRAFGGFALIAIGQIIRNLSARGVFGSGVLLDPEEARRDLEPFSRQAGGMIKDALEEIQPNNLTTPAPPQQIIMIKCPHCSALNQEHAKFCQECGNKL